MKREIRVLNLVAAKIWGGGEQYVYDTAKALGQTGCRMFTAVDAGNREMAARFAEISTVYAVPLRRLNGLPSVFALARFIRTNRISHLMIHTGKMAVLAICLKRLTGVRLVFVKHNVVANKTDFYHRLIQKNTDAFVCVSRLVYDAQTLQNPFQNKYTIIHNGIDTDRFPDLPVQADPDFFTVCYAGRISPEKGLDILTDSVAALHAKYPQIRLKIFGQGNPEYTAQLQQRITRLSAQKFIVLEGFTDNVGEAYRRSDAVVLPTLVPEAFGLALCEAMFCQTAVISNTLGAQKEIIEHGQSGILLDTPSVQALSDALESLIRHPELKQKLAENGRKTVASRFTVRQTADELFSLLGSL